MNPGSVECPANAQGSTEYLQEGQVMMPIQSLLRQLRLVCLLLLGICASGCTSTMSTMDNLAYRVQDEYDASAGMSIETAAIIEGSYSSMINPLNSGHSCFFAVPSGEDVVNARRLVLEPGIRKIPVRCRVSSPYGQNSAEYRRIFEVDLRQSSLYEVRTDGSRFDATKHCLIVVDVSTDAEVARSCDEPFWKHDPNGFCQAGIEWMC